MSLSKSRRTSYRYHVKCEECEKEFDSNYVAHSRIVHHGRKVKCLQVVESSQLKLSGFFSKSSAAVKSNCYGCNRAVPKFIREPRRVSNFN